MVEFLSSDQAVQDAHPHTTYDLLANICHDGPAGKPATEAAIKACVHWTVCVLLCYCCNQLLIKKRFLVFGFWLIYDYQFVH